MGGGDQQKEMQERQQAMEDMKNSILSQVLTQQARARCKTTTAWSCYFDKLFSLNRTGRFICHFGYKCRTVVIAYDWLQSQYWKADIQKCNYIHVVDDILKLLNIYLFFLFISISPFVEI